jgi:sRNA-binding protein
MRITKQDMDAALVCLVETFPQTFVLEKYRPHRPLKVGIAAEIPARCPDLERRVLGAVMSGYTKRVMYLQGLVAGAARIDLDGNPAGEVSVDEAEHAIVKLAGILESRKPMRGPATRADLSLRRDRGSPPSSTVETSPEPPPEPKTPPIAICDEAESIGTKLAEPAAPPVTKVLSLKERPVLRLPAFRQKYG